MPCAWAPLCPACPGSCGADIFQEQPLGSAKLFEEVDATAAAIAAAHWLQAAAQVAAECADCDPTLVMVEADNIEALAVRTRALSWRCSTPARLQGRSSWAW